MRARWWRPTLVLTRALLQRVAVGLFGVECCLEVHVWGSRFVLPVPACSGLKKSVASMKFIRESCLGLIRLFRLCMLHLCDRLKLLKNGCIYIKLGETSTTDSLSSTSVMYFKIPGDTETSQVNRLMSSIKRSQYSTAERSWSANRHGSPFRPRQPELCSQVSHLFIASFSGLRSGSRVRVLLCLRHRQKDEGLL